MVRGDWKQHLESRDQQVPEENISGRIGKDSEV